MEQWITLIPANTIILNSFKFKSNLLSISSQRATNIYLPCASRANRSRAGACCLQKGLPDKPMERAGGRAHTYVLIETMINCTTEGLTVTVFPSRPAINHSVLLRSVFPVTYVLNLHHSSYSSTYVFL